MNGWGMNNPRFEWIDRAFQAYLDAHPTLREKWLLAQTIYTGPTRRSLLSVLPLQTGHRVLDIGTGFGAMTFDLGVHQSLQISSIDVDEQALDAARSIYNQLQVVGAFQSGTRISFTKADIEELPYEDNGFDFVVGRFVYQHLQNPQAATLEIFRVVRPGGHICLIDIDDQLVLTYPEHVGGFSRLQDAFIKLQHRKGGDRYVGRKLATYLQEGGFQVLATVIQPESQYAQIQTDDLGFQFMIDRFQQVREEILAHNLLTADEFDSSLEEIIRDAGCFQYHANGTVVVLAKKPLPQ